jgi:lysophospholipid acyltransferase (LPLAT)-like uncharacterized protein
MKALLRTRPAQALMPAALGQYLAFALRTTRWTMEGEAHFTPYALGAPAIFAFWHEFLPVMPAFTLFARKLPGYRPIRMHTLVSQHRDGQFIGNIVRRFGIEPILGSSSRGGAAGLRRLIAVLRAGDIIGITPDGPRGPRHQAAAGVAQLATLSGVPILPCAARTSRRIQLNTWDRMAVPLPFGRGVLVCGPPITVARGTGEQALPAIAAALDQAAARAQALCPS